MRTFTREAIFYNIQCEDPNYKYHSTRPEIWNLVKEALDPNVVYTPK